jgi:2-polyprenyl-6-methoxyphenol hydroxylase-like FAD-dependent oxidoreductase
MAFGSLEVGIVGCGVAGQAAASFLAAAGHRVTVMERFRQAGRVGAGLLLQPTGLAVLRALGLEEAALAGGARIDGLLGLNQYGTTVLDLAYGDLHPAAFGLGIRRSALFDLLHGRLLTSGARLLTGLDIVDVERDGPRALAVDAGGGRHGPFDLLVVADGAHSHLRDRLMPEAWAPLYPWGCIWATAPDITGLGAPRLLQQRFAGSRQMMGVLPVARDAVTMFWSLPAAALEQDQPIDLETVRWQALKLWPRAAALIERAVDDNAFVRATYRDVWLPRWNDGPVLFIGDAVHGTSPQLGQGANLGLRDAYALDASLRDASDLKAALSLFTRRRRPASRFYRQASRLLTPFFQSDGAALAILRDLTLRHACYAPMTGSMMAATLAGLRRGWLSSDGLDKDGRFVL